MASTLSNVTISHAPNRSLPYNTRKAWASPAMLLGVGVVMVVPYGVAWLYQDLRTHTIPFLWIFFVTFLLYALATLIALRLPNLTRRQMVIVFGLAAVMNGILLFTPPTLSDDMYRYVWDGRVQAQGISPYRYPPNSLALLHLRDDKVYPFINRKNVVTVYPPAAEATYAFLWRLAPDSVRFFQGAMAVGGLVAGGLLVGLLRTMGQSTARVVLFLWSPLLIYETAHAAHIDGLLLPLLVGLWWARLREKDTLVGLLLGVATAMKLYPVLLFPTVWRPTHPTGRWRMPLAFVMMLGLWYLPYYLQIGSGVLGYLPSYFKERFNAGLTAIFIFLMERAGVDVQTGITLIYLSVLGLIGLLLLLRPPTEHGTAIRRSIWLIGGFTIFSQNLFSWYMLWLLPLLALFVEPAPRRGLRLNSWTGWWLFCGLVGLSYSFFIAWRNIPLAVMAQYIPLGLFLAIDGVQWLRRRRVAPYGTE
jgi:alpha-1,6-mannosyltransferase